MEFIAASCRFTANALDRLPLKSAPHCRDCPRLARFLDQVAADHPGYHAKPVPAFGAERPRLLIVGLAPGMHGANRTGRPFTGDHAGILLYETLHKFGYATAPVSTHTADGLKLTRCRIVNAVQCLPPQNKPLPAEVRQCNRFLKEELQALPNGAAILALGGIAHEAVLLAYGLKKADYRFGHGAAHALPNAPILFDSYHCSRYNTQTRRLTPAMFESVFAIISNHLSRR